MKRRFKVKKQVMGGGSRLYHKWTEWTEGDYVIGVLENSILDNYKKKCPVLNVLEWQFSSPVLDLEKNTVTSLEGKLLQLNACGSLSYAFYTVDEKRNKEEIPIGSIVQVLYTGTGVMEKGTYEGKDFHTVEVSILNEIEEEGIEDETGEQW